MAYTLWYSGILIGESDLEHPMRHARQRGGVFRPTAYGVEVFPRLTGILSAGHALKTYLDANGKSADNMNADEIETIFTSHPAGQKIIDIGRALSECELRSPEGTPLEFESIGFSDVRELESVARELGCGGVRDAAKADDDGPRYIVSATLKESTSKGRKRAVRARGRPWPNDN